MTWTRLSDDHFDQPTQLALSRSARLLHLEALVWCNRALTDGGLPRGALSRLTDSEDVCADVAELVAAGVWIEDDSGWTIDWSSQEPAEDVRRRQAKSVEKQRRYRRHRAGDHRDCLPKTCKDAPNTDETTIGVTGNATSNKTGRVTPSPPGPARPGPKEPGRGRLCSHGHPVGVDEAGCASCVDEANTERSPIIVEHAAQARAAIAAKVTRRPA